jgi:hypothetical protein
MSMPLPETEENHERTFECLIDIRLDDEDFIFKALLGIFPGLQCTEAIPPGTRFEYGEQARPSAWV